MRERKSADRVPILAVALIALPVFVACGPTSGHLYGCVLQGARIPVKLQFTDDFLSPRQHRCFRATATVVQDVSMTSFGYTCAFGRAN
jgi:hypothetical protein